MILNHLMSQKAWEIFTSSTIENPMSYPQHFEVDSIQEAVTLAIQLRERGDYNIFRGQTCDWPIRPSFTRLPPDKQAQATNRFLEFARFVERTPELSDLHRNRLGVMAVAQHYGIPTVLVDFTTQPIVAGWFASEGSSPPDGRQSVIYLAHEEYIASCYKDWLEQLYSFRMEIDNLWRLQAQHGLFLHLPFENKPELDEILAHAFGSIRFPYSGPMGEIPEEAIYPSRKSRLEILFDGFLSEEKQRKVQEGAESLGLKFIKAPASPRLRPAPAFINEQAPPVLDSWNPDRIQAWLRPPVEDFHRQDLPPVFNLQLDPQQLWEGDPKELQQTLKENIQEILDPATEIRSHLLNFSVKLAGHEEELGDRLHPESRLRRSFSQDLADCWDGMRLFPYSNEVIASALAYLTITWARVHVCKQSLYKTQQYLLGETVLAEFGLVEGGQHSLATIPNEEVAAAFRSDIRDWLKPEYHSMLKKPERILHQVIDPRRLFDFKPFVELFGKRMVPGQFMIRQREIIFYSPARIEQLGNR